MDKVSFVITRTRWLYGNETVKSFLEDNDLTRESLAGEIDALTFENEQECLEHQPQIGINDAPKHMKIRISLTAEEIPTVKKEDFFNTL